MVKKINFKEILNEGLGSDHEMSNQPLRGMAETITQLREWLKGHRTEQGALDTDTLLEMVSNLKELIMTLKVLVDSKTDENVKNQPHPADLSEAREEMEEIRQSLKELEQRVKLVDRAGDDEVLDADREQCHGEKEELFRLKEEEHKLLVYETGGSTVKQLLQEEVKKAEEGLHSKKEVVTRLRDEIKSLKEKFLLSGAQLEELELEEEKLAVEKATFENNKEKMKGTLKEKVLQGQKLKEEVAKLKNQSKEESKRVSVKSQQVDKYKKRARELRKQVDEEKVRNEKLMRDLVKVLKESVEIEEKLEEEGVKKNVLEKKIKEMSG